MLASSPALSSSAEAAPRFQRTAAENTVDFNTLPWNSPAVVLWLAQGETPGATEHSCSGATLLPPACDLLTFWTLGQAVMHAGSSHRDHGKQPWIKMGDVILPPADVLGSYDFYRHHGTRK